MARRNGTIDDLLHEWRSMTHFTPAGAGTVRVWALGECPNCHGQVMEGDNVQVAAIGSTPAQRWFLSVMDHHGRIGHLALWGDSMPLPHELCCDDTRGGEVFCDGCYDPLPEPREDAPLTAAVEALPCPLPAPATLKVALEIAARLACGDTPFRRVHVDSATGDIHLSEYDRTPEGQPVPGSARRDYMMILREAPR